MIKIISLNIEIGRHFNKHRDFFKSEKADIVCFQEILKGDIEKYKKLLDLKYSCFAPMSQNVINNKTQMHGISILSKYKITSLEIYDVFSLQKEKNCDKLITSKYLLKKHYHMIFLSLIVGNKTYNIATTHAPVTCRGDYITDFQRTFFKNLKSILKNKKSFILTGDFNSGRNYELFDDLSILYTDNIPKKYNTSIDNKIHRKGYNNIQFVVDGFFTTKDIVVKKIKYQDGVSDHCAVVAEVE